MMNSTERQVIRSLLDGLTDDEKKRFNFHPIAFLETRAAEEDRLFQGVDLEIERLQRELAARERELIDVYSGRKGLPVQQSGQWRDPVTTGEPFPLDLAAVLIAILLIGFGLGWLIFGVLL